MRTSLADIPGRRVSARSIDLSAPSYMSAVLFIRYCEKSEDSKVSNEGEKREEAKGMSRWEESARPKSLLSLRRCTNDFASSAACN